MFTKTILLQVKQDSLENSQKEEFYNILNQVCKKNETISNISVPKPDVEKGRATVAGYKEFATGVTGKQSC